MLRCPYGQGYTGLYYVRNRRYRDRHPRWGVCLLATARPRAPGPDSYRHSVDRRTGCPLFHTPGYTAVYRGDMRLRPRLRRRVRVPLHLLPADHRRCDELLLRDAAISRNDKRPAIDLKYRWRERLGK